MTSTHLLPDIHRPTAEASTARSGKRRNALWAEPSSDNHEQAQEELCHGLSDDSEDSVSSGNTMAPSNKTHGEPDAIAKMDHLKDMILNSARAEVKTQNKNIMLKSHDEERKQKRKEWLHIERELHQAQSLASWSVQATPLRVQLEMLRNLRQAVCEAVYFLVEGTQPSSNTDRTRSNPFILAVPPEVRKDRSKRSCTRVGNRDYQSREPKYFVWSSPQAARYAIVRQAIAFHDRRKSKPLVVLVLEQSHDRTPKSQKSSASAVDCSDRDAFIEDWAAASREVADLITVVATSSNQIRAAVEDVFKEASREGLLVPVLVCLHASDNSRISSDIGGVRAVCHSFDSQLCVEGSALTMIAQPDRPSDPDECVSNADVLLIEPGAWFGFRMCAALSRHQYATRVSGQFWSDDVTSESIMSFSDNDNKKGHATGPILNLWVVLSRLNLESIRSRIDGITALAECFVHIFRSSPNVQAVYDGVGCSIRLSYAMSREDRLMTKKKADENISSVNGIIFENLEEESKALMITKETVDDNTWLQFAPASLLRSGTCWIPKREDVERYADQVQETVNKYECCQAGSVSFESEVAKCKDVQLAGPKEIGSSLALCFGAIRVVPYELCTSWRETSSSIDVVGELTHQLVSELRDSAGNIFSRSFLLREELPGAAFIPRRYCSDGRSDIHLIRAGHQNLSRHQAEHEVEPGLPFAIYFNTNLGNGAPDFLSVEPIDACTPVEAVRQAAFAAEVFSAAVEAITSRWRDVNRISEIPRDLANIAGKEDFIPLTTPRKSLGLSNLIRKTVTPSQASRIEAAWDVGSQATESGAKLLARDLDTTDSEDDGYFSVRSQLIDADVILASPSTSSTSVCSGSEHLHGAHPHPKQYGLCDFAGESTNTHRVSQAREDRDQPESFARKAENGLGKEDGDCIPEKHQGVKESGALRPKPQQDMKTYGWFESWRRGSNQESSSAQKGNRKDTEAKQDHHRNRDRGSTAAENPGGSEGSTSPSESEDSGDENDEDSDDEDEESGDETEKSEKTSTEESESLNSASESETGDDEGLSTVGSTSMDGGSIAEGVEPGWRHSGLFSWFRRNGAQESDANTAVAEPAHSRGEDDADLTESGGSSTGSVDTSLSEVPTDWISRRLDDWESQASLPRYRDVIEVQEQNSNAHAGKSRGKAEVERTSTGPSAFGFAWLTRRYLGTAASADAGVKGVANVETRESVQQEESESEASCSDDVQSENDEFSSTSSSHSSVEEDESSVSREQEYSEHSESDQREDEHTDESSGSSEDSEEESLQSESIHSEASSDSESCTQTNETDSSSSDGQGESDSDGSDSSGDGSEESEGPERRATEATESKTLIGRYLSWLNTRWASRTTAGQKHQGSAERSARYSELSTDSESDSRPTRGNHMVRTERSSRRSSRRSHPDRRRD